MTDLELTKAPRYCLEQENCDSFCPYREDNRGCKYVSLKDTYDLIKRLTSALVKEKHKNSKLRNKRNRLRVENERLKKETEAKDGEIEKLVETISILEKENNALAEKNNSVDFCYNGNSYNLGGYWDR